MLAGRTLLLANELAGTPNAEFRAYAAPFLHNAVLRMRHYLATGRFARLADELPVG